MRPESAYYGSGLEELQQELENSRKELIGLIENWLDIKNNIYPQILDEYKSEFGDLENQLEDKQKESEELDNYLSEILKINSVPNSGRTNGTIPRLEKSGFCFDTFDKDFSRDILPESSVNNRYEVIRHYRTLVKQLHPDVSGITSEFRKYWVDIQDSYKKDNLPRLRLFSAALVKTGELPPERMRAFEYLRNQIREISRLANIEKSKLEMIKKSKPFEVRQKLKDKSWVSRRKKALLARISTLDIIISTKRSRLVKLQSGPKEKVLKKVTSTSSRR
jgi:hypothetical protein